MERMKMHSRDNVAANVEVVGRLFPPGADRGHAGWEDRAGD